MIISLEFFPIAFYVSIKKGKEKDGVDDEMCVLCRR